MDPRFIEPTTEEAYDEVSYLLHELHEYSLRLRCYYCGVESFAVKELEPVYDPHYGGGSTAIYELECGHEYACV